jgi:SAM-dependent methyltransferase
MAEPQIRFNDGAGYERLMGVWSRLVGKIFLDWLAPRAGLRWIDVGCGNGAFTELIVQRCAPAEVSGIDPSEGQLAFARARPTTHIVQFRQGDAMALPFAAHTFNAAVMALVIFFVPDPANCLAEMVRVVAPGGLIGAYAWDVMGGGFPLLPIQTELRAMGVPVPRPPSSDVSRAEALHKLWTDAGLEDVETRKIEVQRTFPDFDDFWTTAMLSSSTGSTVAAMSPDDATLLKRRVRAGLPADDAGRITYRTWANAVKGRVPS